MSHQYFDLIAGVQKLVVGSTPAQKMSDWATQMNYSEEVVRLLEDYEGTIDL